eukprot:363766-Chlamydomonas_euryale.AAC.3
MCAPGQRAAFHDTHAPVCVQQPELGRCKLGPLALAGTWGAGLRSFALAAATGAGHDAGTPCAAVAGTRRRTVANSTPAGAAARHRCHMVKLCVPTQRHVHTYPAANTEAHAWQRQ